MSNTKLAIIALAVIAGLALLIFLFLLWKRQRPADFIVTLYDITILPICQG